MAQKKSLMQKAIDAAKKVVAKPITPKKVAKKVATKPITPKKVAKKVATKPITPKKVAKKVVAKKPGALKKFNSYKPRANESFMNKTQIKHFIKILNDWKLELGNDIDRTVSHMQDEITAYADPNDRASQESDMALELRNRDRERKLIKKIDVTLLNIKNKEYGYCNLCGEEIGLNRLLARPTATLCIDCKTLDEIREKQMAK